MKKLRVRDVTFHIQALPEDMPIRGNISAIDPETDRRAEERVAREIERGNEWAWCVVRVTARFAGFIGEAYLGGCSYASEKAFKRGGYWGDLKKEAFDDLVAKLQQAKASLDGIDISTELDYAGR